MYADSSASSPSTFSNNKKTWVFFFEKFAIPIFRRFHVISALIIFHEHCALIKCEQYRIPGPNQDISNVISAEFARIHQFYSVCAKDNRQQKYAYGFCAMIWWCLLERSVMHESQCYSHFFIFVRISMAVVIWILWCHEMECNQNGSMCRI